jgi:hypothetical protein
VPGINPFRYTDPVGPEDLIDRETEEAGLVQRAIEANNSRLVAPRRFGKTSLLRKVAADLDDEGWATVHVDLFGVLTLADVGERIEQAYTRQLRGGIATWFSGLRRILPGLRLGGGPVPVGAQLDLVAAETPLRERLRLPVRIFERHGTRVLVVFDEFSEVLAASGNADAVIRSEIQHHGSAASYIFAGSAVGMMSELFGDRRRAFYGQAGPVELPPLPSAALAAFVGRRFNETGKEAGEGLRLLLDLAQGHPQRSMLIAHALWNATPDGQVADASSFAAAYQAALAEVRDELRAIWSGLPAGQRRVLAAIAGQTGPLYSRKGGGSGGGAVRQAVTALIAAGEVVRDPGQPTGHRVVDPLLAAWINDGTPGA